jgi:hypothetical protein
MLSSGGVFAAQQQLFGVFRRGSTTGGAKLTEVSGAAENPGLSDVLDLVTDTDGPTLAAGELLVQCGGGHRQ